MTAAWSTRQRPGARSWGPALGEFAAALGMPLLPWQSEVAGQWLEVDDAGALTRSSATLVVPRRNGKTELIVLRCLFGILALGERRVLYTAHLADTAREAFGKFLALCQHPDVAATVERPYRTRGNEWVAFVDGSEFVTRTRSDGTGRGLECDLLVLDEALLATEEHDAALTPLTAAAEARGRGQLLVASSAGSASSAVLMRYRDTGRAACAVSAPAVAYHEWSVPRDVDPVDPVVQAAANPSAGSPFLTARFLATQQRRMGRERFGREHLGWWADTAELPAILPETWDGCAVEVMPDLEVGGPRWLAFDVAPERSEARLLGFARDQVGRVVVSVLWSVSGPVNVPDFADVVVGVADEWRPEEVAFDRLTGDAVARALEAAGHRVRWLTAGEYAAACSGLQAAVDAGTVAHDGHPALADDLARAVAKPYADGGWTFSRRASQAGPIPGAVAAAVGWWLASTPDAADDHVVAARAG